MIQFLSRNLSTTSWINRFKRTYISELYLIPFFTRLRGKEVLYVLHVNKAAGTSLFRGITENQTSFLKTRLLCMPHRFGLHNLPKKCKGCLVHSVSRSSFCIRFWEYKKKGIPTLFYRMVQRRSCYFWAVQKFWWVGVRHVFVQSKATGFSLFSLGWDYTPKALIRSLCGRPKLLKWKPSSDYFHRRARNVW